MTSVFYLYYFIDSWTGVVPVRRVSMHLASSHFPIVSISASGSYFEKRRSKEQIFAHCCCWLIQPCGKWPRSTQMEPLGLNHSLSHEKKWRFPQGSEGSRLYLSLRGFKKSKTSNFDVPSSSIKSFFRMSSDSVTIINEAVKPPKQADTTFHNSQLQEEKDSPAVPALTSQRSFQGQEDPEISALGARFSCPSKVRRTILKWILLNQLGATDDVGQNRVWPGKIRPSH